MGAGASALSQDEVKLLPQYAIMGGDAKFDELKGEDGMVEVSKFEDPYLKFGGAYVGDEKDTKDFKYVTFGELPVFSPAHKSLMSKVLSPELFTQLKDIKVCATFSSVANVDVCFDLYYPVRVPRATPYPTPS
jgi:hypothetical protein